MKEFSELNKHSPPSIFLFSHEVAKLKQANKSSGNGIAILIDCENGMPDVIHLHLASPAKVSPLMNQQIIEFDWSLATSYPVKKEKKHSKSSIKVWINNETEVPTAVCDLKLMAYESQQLSVQIIQTESKAFSRNTAILETRLLRDKTVLCLGLGSGGSIVADQLARSGVGRFILWDMDKLETHNIGRHLCTLEDIGRRKVYAIQDHILSVNPAASIECIDQNVLDATGKGSTLEARVLEADCIIVGTDNNASRYAVNEVAWKNGKTVLYGRAYTRAAGGDVVQVIPGSTPCYSCHTLSRAIEEEISSAKDADRVAYSDVQVPIEPGLVIDIHPIANMLARLALLRVCENLESSLKSAAEETRAPIYLWANRREAQFKNWEPMERTFDRLSVYRWYAIGFPQNKECMICG